MLKLRFVDNRQPAFWAMEKQFSIGRDATNHLSIDDATVDPRHASLVHRGDQFLLKDLGSHHGTFVNGTRITQKSIACGDTLQFGNVWLEVIDPFLSDDDTPVWALIADSSWLTGQEFPLRVGLEQPPVVLGRSNDCDIVIPGTHLSRRHAEISLNESGLQIRDLESANGTFVNDRKIKGSRLKPGDRLRLDVYSFKVFGPGIALPRAATQVMKAIDESMIEARSGEPQEKLWATKATSPGNRHQENLYKRRWLPAAIAIAILAAFLGGLGYYLFAL